MTNPESPISQDAALSSFMSAAIGDPETSRAAPEGDTVTRTGNTADHQDGWFAGIDHGRAEARDIAAAVHSAPALATPAVRNWKPVQAAIDDYLEGYELRLDEGCYTPQEFERFLLVDAIAGLMEDDEFIDALYSTVTAARATPAAGDARAAAARDVLAERRRQVEIGYDAEHDDAHVNDEIAALACYYLMPPGARAWPAAETGYGDTLGKAIIPHGWHGDDRQSRRHQLVMGTAMGPAEIERLDRAAIAAQQGNGGEA